MPTPWSAGCSTICAPPVSSSTRSIVVAADHGESLGEHGERTHGVFVYDATMRVPWIISGSGFRVQGSRRTSDDRLVRLIDLAPTVLDLVGVAAPPEFEGTRSRPRSG